MSRLLNLFAKTASQVSKKVSDGVGEVAVMPAFKGVLGTVVLAAAAAGMSPQAMAQECAPQPKAGVSKAVGAVVGGGIAHAAGRALGFNSAWEAMSALAGAAAGAKFVNDDLDKPFTIMLVGDPALNQQQAGGYGSGRSFGSSQSIGRGMTPAGYQTQQDSSLSSLPLGQLPISLQSEQRAVQLLFNEDAAERNLLGVCKEAHVGVAANMMDLAVTAVAASKLHRRVTNTSVEAAIKGVAVDAAGGAAIDVMRKEVAQRDSMVARNTALSQQIRSMGATRGSDVMNVFLNMCGGDPASVAKKCERAMESVPGFKERVEERVTQLYAGAPVPGVPNTTLKDAADKAAPSVEMLQAAVARARSGQSE